MSRMATNEYIGAKRRVYTEAKPARRRRILDKVCETTGHSRKYANRLVTGVYATRDALDTALGRIPFDVWSVHHDNGKEYVDNAVAEWRGKRRKIPFSRSRPYRKNDNAHVEQKNGPVVRTLLGEGRLDRPGLEREPSRLCEDYSDFRNFYVPCKMPVAKRNGALPPHHEKATPRLENAAPPPPPEIPHRPFKKAPGI